MQKRPEIYVIDDDAAVRDAIARLLDSVGMQFVSVSSAEEFLDLRQVSDLGCIVLDIRMRGMSGMELLKRLKSLHIHLPVIIITGHGDIPMAVEALKGGALDFIEKPFRNQALLDRIQQAIQLSARTSKDIEIYQRFEQLSDRERELSTLLLDGMSAKGIARTLSLSPRTVETHKANIMKKMGVSNSLELMKDLMAIKNLEKQNTSSVV